MSGNEGDRFRVVIVGAGVAGLTLANALEQAGVDYVLLERRDEVAPQVGASIGVFPNAARILDQLGAWKAVHEGAEPLVVFYNRDSKGELISDPDRSPLLVHARTGYLPAWGERQNLLRVLYENIKERSKVLVNKSLVDIRHDDDGVTAICADGSSFRGDMLVGADGVSSKTRTKMWELAQSDHPDLVKADQNCMICEYNCLFGISKNVTSSQLVAGDVNIGFDRDRVVLSIAAGAGKVYWFAEERLPRTHHASDIPRYTDEDAKAFVDRNRDMIVRSEPDGVKLGNLWDKAVSYRLVALEEAKFQLWHWGRITCVGDSIHKASPNLGVGGNSAVESAAALANGIKRLADSWTETGRRPTRQEVERELVEYQSIRKVRAEAVVDASGLLARAQTMHGLRSRLFVKFLLPHLTEFLPELMGNAMIGATKLDFLPLPMASLTGLNPFNPTQGDGLQESKLKRMVFGLPLIALLFVARYVMDAKPAMGWAEALRDSGVYELPTGSVPILRTFYHIRSVDDFITLVNLFFFPSMYGTDLLGRRQVASFITDIVIVAVIWYFESTRRANMLTPLQWPNLFLLLAQFLSIGFMSPLYCLLHYVLSPVESFSARDRRLTNTRQSFAILPVVLLTCLVPFYFVLLWPDLVARQSILFAWQLYPIWLAVAWRVVSRVFFRDTLAEDKVYNTEKDLPVMKGSVGVFCVLAVGVWWWTLADVGIVKFVQVFVPGGLPTRFTTLGGFASELLRWDEVMSFVTHLVWLAMLFWDLRVAGMLREGWFRVVGLGLVSVVVLGPGATVGLGWLWREQILATRRHKNALTPESVGRLHGEAF